MIFSSYRGGLNMQDFSYHTHTNSFGLFDGRNTTQEMIDAAEQAGMKELGISNHLIYHPNIFSGCEASKNDKMFHADLAESIDIYTRAVEEIHAYAAKSKIKVYAGFEVDFFPSLAWRKDFEKIIEAAKPDYLIGSTHYIRNADESLMCNVYYYSRSGIDKSQTDELLANYWQNIIDCIKSGYFNFIAHLDVCKIHGLGGEEKWNDWKWKVIEALSEYKQPYELNTSGWTKIEEQHPYLWMIEELNKRNVPVIISDDAHRVNHIGQHFAQAEELLANINYKNRYKLIL